MKKLLAIFVLAILLVSVFSITACGNNTPDSQSTVSIITRSQKSKQSSAEESSEEVPTTQSASVGETSNNSTEPIASTQPSQSTQPQVSNEPTTSVETSVEPTIPEDVQTVIYFIQNIGTVDRNNYTTKINQITQAETAYENLSAVNKALVTNYSVLTKAREDYDNFLSERENATLKITQFIGAVNDLGAYEYTQAFKDKLDNCDALYAQIPTAYQAEAADAKVTLDNLKNRYANDKPQEVKDLESAIDAIGEINSTNYTEKLSSIEACETTYGAMDPALQALVSNYATLTAARQAYNNCLSAAELEAQNQAKVQAFKDAVNAITYAFTPECKAQLDSALVLYNQIPSTHTSYAETEKATLDGYFAQYESDKFNALPEEVKSTISAIEAIGTVDASNYVDKESLIVAAETAYAALSVENQALVSNYATLTAARQTFDALKAEEEANQAKVADFITKVSAITAVEYSTACKAQLDAAYASYNLIPSTHTSLVATQKSTLDGYKAQYDALEKAALDKAAVDAFMAKYNAVLPLGSVTATNKATFEEVIATYEALTADQLALITDATVATNIATWKTACDALKPAEPVTTTMSFENDATGMTSTVAMKFVSSKWGKGWQTSSNYKNTTITFTTDASYNNITSLSVYVMSSGGGGVKYNLYIGSTLAGTYSTTSSGFKDERKITYSGTGLSGQIKIEAITNSSNRGAGIDELVFTHLA